MIRMACGMWHAGMAWLASTCVSFSNLRSIFREIVNSDALRGKSNGIKSK